MFAKCEWMLFDAEVPHQFSSWQVNSRQHEDWVESRVSLHSPASLAHLQNAANHNVTHLTAVPANETAAEWEGEEQ